MDNQALWEDRDEDFETDDTNDESEDLSLSADDFEILSLLLLTGRLEPYTN